MRLTKMDQLANCKRARDNVAAAPETDFDLSDYMQAKESGCGTLYCAVGLQATDPHFQELGIRYEKSVFRGRTYYDFICRDPDNRNIRASEHMAQVFGDGAYSKMFATYAYGQYDYDILGEDAWTAYRQASDDGQTDKRSYKTLTDKQLALARMDRFIAEMEAELS